MNMKMTPKFEPVSEVKKFFYDVEDEDGGVTKQMGRLKRNAIIVTDGWGGKFCLMKTNRSKMIRDSRCQKVRTKDSWGNVTERDRPTFLTQDEARAELERTLDSATEADAAMRKLLY